MISIPFYVVDCDSDDMNINQPEQVALLNMDENLLLAYWVDPDKQFIQVHTTLGDWDSPYRKETIEVLSKTLKNRHNIFETEFKKS
jgi:hypothetical protein